jgi:hypothetical protein
MQPIENAHTLDQQEVNGRLGIVPSGTIPSSLLASALVRGVQAPMSSVTPPEAAAIKRRRWRSVWTRTLRNHRSPTANDVRAGRPAATKSGPR